MEFMDRVERKNIKCLEKKGLRRVRGTQRRSPPTYIEITFLAIQSTLRSLEMHSKRCYEICIGSVILGQLEPFEITRASVLFS